MRLEYVRSPLCRTPVYVFGEGNTNAAIVSGMHGDEHTSVLACVLLCKLIRRIEDKLNGRVIVIPIANFEAFKYRRRLSLVDGLDLNRCFPGREGGSPTERHAWALWELVSEADYIIDVHTCGNCIPYILAMRAEGRRLGKLIRAIPIVDVVESHGTRGQLFIEATMRGKSAAILELPQRCYSSLSLRQASIFARKILQTLINLDILGGDHVYMGHRYLGKRTDVVAPHRGLFLPKRRKGGVVGREETLGTIRGSSIVSPIEGILLAIRPPSFVFCGEKVASVAPIITTSDEILKEKIE